MSSKLQTALENVSGDPKLGAADQDHLKRWATYGDDIAWEKIEADAEAQGLLPSGSAHETVIRYSLMTRRIAESVKLGDDPLFAEKTQRRDSLLALADKADALAKYYAQAEKFDGIAMFYQRYLKPVSELQDLHKQEAVLLRRRAGKKPMPTTFISRQGGGKGKRFYSRKHNAFMYLMAQQLGEICGRPHHDAVSTITNIAFLDAQVTAENVRNALRAPTRRRRGTRTSK
jgi:hypothetical protein